MRLFRVCSVLGCPRANVSQSAQQSDNKSSAGFVRRSAKTRNDNASDAAAAASSSPVERRQLAKRVTRQNGGSVEDVKLPVGKKGTAAALMVGGRRAAASNETRGETAKISTQQTRRIGGVDKPVGNSTSTQRKAAKAKRTPDDTAADSKTKGGSAKRRRLHEDRDDKVGTEVEDAAATVETVVRHSVIEEELVDTSEVSIGEDEPEPLDEDKKRRIEETQHLLKLISVDAAVAPATGASVRSSSNRSSSPQQAEKRRDAENGDAAVSQSRVEATIRSKDLDVTVSELKEEVTGEDRNKDVECHSKSRKVSDCAAAPSGKLDEYFPPVDAAGSEAFTDGDDVENLLRIERRCASVQSWVARRSHEDVDVEQMDVEEEVTVEAGEVLLDEACRSPDSEVIGGGNGRSPETDESAVVASTTAAAAARSVVEETAAFDKPSDEGADVSVPSRQAVVESLTAADENGAVQQSSDVNSRADTGDLIEEESVDNFGVDCSSSKQSATSEDLSSAEIRDVAVEKVEQNIPFAHTTESIVVTADRSDNDDNTKSFSTGSSTDAAGGRATRESVGGIGTVPCTVVKTSDVTVAQSDVVPDAVRLDTVAPTANDSQKSTPSEAAASQNDADSLTPTDGDEDEDAACHVAGDTADKSSENSAETSLTAEQQHDRSTDAGGAPSSNEKLRVTAEPEDGKRSSEMHAETAASADDAAEAGNTSLEGSADKVATSMAVSVQPAQLPPVAVSSTSGAPAVSVVVARTFTSTVAGSGAPAVTSVVSAGAVPGFVGMPPVALRAAVPGSPVGSVFVHVADPRQFAMHLQQQQQQQQQGQVQAGQAQAPVFHIPTLSPQQGGGPPQLVMSPLSPQQVALLSSSMPPTSQSPHQLVPGPRHVTLVTSGPRPQLLQQCLLTSAGPQPLTLLPAPQPPPAASASNSTSGATSTTAAAAAQPSVPVQHLAILSHALHGGTAASTTAPTSGHQQPVALIAAAGPNQTPVMRMTPAATVIPRHPMSASSAMQHLTSAVQQTISLQQLQLSFAAAAAAAQQQQLASSAVRSSIPIQRLPVLCTTQPSGSSPATAATSIAVVSVAAAAPVVSMPVSPMVSVAASALTAFLKKDSNVVTSQLLPPPPSTIAKLSPHDVALKGRFLIRSLFADLFKQRIQLLWLRFLSFCGEVATCSASVFASYDTFLRSVVCLSVVCHSRAPCLKRSTDFHAIWHLHLEIQ